MSSTGISSTKTYLAFVKVWQFTGNNALEIKDLIKETDIDFKDNMIIVTDDSAQWLIKESYFVAILHGYILGLFETKEDVEKEYVPVS